MDFWGIIGDDQAMEEVCVDYELRIFVFYHPLP